MVAIKDEWSRNLKTSERKKHKYREIQDAVHDTIRIYYPVQDIIDTPEFQRLRKLKQTGITCLVFPDAVHTRFSHSLGVYHLADRALLALKSCLDASITGNDELCILIAALLHDLGHGPFSHFYDGHFLSRVNPTAKWRHEEGSVKVFEHMLNANPKLRATLDEFLCERDYSFIKELIDPPKEFIKNGEWQLQGRPQVKSYLYGIVSNVHDGFDVDKFDYFLRDSQITHVPIAFNASSVQRIFSTLDVTKDQERHFSRICHAEKVALDELKNAADSRMRLHDRVYQHKTIVAAEHLMVEAWRLADDHLLFKGSDGQLYKLSEAFNNITAFLKTNDSVILDLAESNPALGPAVDVLNKIERRELPRYIGRIGLSSDADEKAIAGIKREVVERLGLREDSVITRVVNIHSGSPRGINSHPLEEVLVYNHKSGARDGGIGAMKLRFINYNELPRGSKSLFVYVPYDTDAEERQRLTNALQEMDTASKSDHNSNLREGPIVSIRRG